MELVPIKVKIGLRPNGHADHPDWSQLPLAATEDPAEHMRHGGSWHYDKKSGHTDDDPESPRRMQWGGVLVTEQFAAEALVVFPELVTEMTELEWQEFWDHRVHGHMPECQCDTDLLVALKAERDLRFTLKLDLDAIDARILKALDADDDEPGIKKDKMRKWADAKLKMGVTIKP